jgi:hypothetical protein
MVNRAAINNRVFSSRVAERKSVPILTTGRWNRSPNRKVVPRRLIQSFTFMKVSVMIAKKMKPILINSAISLQLGFELFCGGKSPVDKETKTFLSILQKEVLQLSSS